MVDSENIIRNKERNTKIYPIYKMFSWDLLFYYAIIYLFLSQEKGMTSAEIFFGDAFYPLFKAIMLVLAPRIVEKMGKIKSNFFGNLFISLSILYIMISRKRCNSLDNCQSNNGNWLCS